jgi:hypothetical protein
MMDLEQDYAADEATAKNGSRRGNNNFPNTIPKSITLNSQKNLLI